MASVLHIEPGTISGEMTNKQKSWFIFHFNKAQHHRLKCRLLYTTAQSPSTLQLTYSTATIMCSCSTTVHTHNLPSQPKSAVMRVYIIVKKRVKLDCWLINRSPWYWFTTYILVYILVPHPEVQTGMGWPGNEVVIIPGCISPALLQCTAVLGQAARQTFGRSRNLSVCWGKNHKWQYSELHGGFQPPLKCASPTSPHNGCLYSLDWTTGLDYWTDLFATKIILCPVISLTCLHLARKRLVNLL